MGRTNERTSEILFLPLEHKIHILSPPCNILYLANRKRERGIFTSEIKNSLVHNRGPRVSVRLLNSTWLVLGLLVWKAPLKSLSKTRKPEHCEENETRRCFVDRVPSNTVQTKGKTRSELSVRTKGQDYEPSSLRGMVASFERHL